MSGPDNALIDETVLDSLRPKARRYDVAVDSELVISVLPNGSKAWTWVHAGPGQPRRQTLGVYPDMSVAEARRAAGAAADAERRRGDAPTSPYVIRDGRIQAAGTGIDWKWPLVAGAIVLIAGGAFGWLLVGWPSDAPDTPRAAPVAEAMTLDTTLDAKVQPGRRVAPSSPLPSPPEPSPHRAPDAEQLPPDALPAGEAPANKLDAEVQLLRETAVTQNQAASLPPPESVPVAAPEPTPEPGARPEPVQSEPATEPPPVETAAAAPPPAALSEPAAQPESTPVRTAAAAVDTRATAIAPPTSAPVDAPAGVIGSRLTAAADVALLETDPRVARAAITTDVVEREPVDRLGPVIVGDGTDLQALYFFTELRQLQGQRVRHRWIAGDRIQAEVPFEVGGAWRWRVYSSKRLLASQAGPWRVQVVLDDGTVVYSFPFEFQP